MKHKAKNQQGLDTLKRLLILQLGLTLLICAVCIVFFGTRTAFSALLAGIVCIVPNVFFGFMVFKHRGARAAKQIMSSFYKAEAVKILVTMILFLLVFINYAVAPLAFFLTYIIVQFSHWLIPLVLANKRIG